MSCNYLFLSRKNYPLPVPPCLTSSGPVPDSKTTCSVRAVRLEVNEQLIPTGHDVSRQIVTTECVDQWSCGVSSVVNVHFVATTVAAFWERQVDEVQTHELQTHALYILFFIMRDITYLYIHSIWQHQFFPFDRTS